MSTNTPLQRCRKNVNAWSNALDAAFATTCDKPLPCPDHPADRVAEQSQPERVSPSKLVDAIAADILSNDSDAVNIADLQSRLTAAMERERTLTDALARAANGELHSLVVTKLGNRAASAESENKRLREALEKYGRHADDCDFIFCDLCFEDMEAHPVTANHEVGWSLQLPKHDFASASPCSCGLSAALSTTKKESER